MRARTFLNRYDVGGQRNERRKWIHKFDNVDSMVFVASLSEFDQMLYEDETKPRLDESLELWSQIVNSRWFQECANFLFLNKKDLFEKKVTAPTPCLPLVATACFQASCLLTFLMCCVQLQDKVMSDYVGSYDGPNEMKPCLEHIKRLYLDKKRNQEKTIFTHITTAIDTSNVKFVFNAVVAMILEQNLLASGLS